MDEQVRVADLRVAVEERGPSWMHVQLWAVAFQAAAQRVLAEVTDEDLRACGMPVQAAALWATREAQRTLDLYDVAVACAREELQRAHAQMAAAGTVRTVDEAIGMTAEAMKTLDDAMSNLLVLDAFAGADDGAGEDDDVLADQPPCDGQCAACAARRPQA